MAPATSGFELRDAATGGASDANTTAGMGVPTIDGLGPIGGLDHSPGEYLEVASIVPRTVLLAALIAAIGRDPEVGRWRAERRGAGAGRAVSRRHVVERRAVGGVRAATRGRWRWATRASSPGRPTPGRTASRCTRATPPPRRGPRSRSWRARSSRPGFALGRRGPDPDVRRRRPATPMRWPRSTASCSGTCGRRRRWWSSRGLMRAQPAGRGGGRGPPGALLAGSPSRRVPTSRRDRHQRDARDEAEEQVPAPRDDRHAHEHAEDVHRRARSSAPRRRRCGRGSASRRCDASTAGPDEPQVEQGPRRQPLDARGEERQRPATGRSRPSSAARAGRARCSRRPAPGSSGGSRPVPQPRRAHRPRRHVLELLEGLVHVARSQRAATTPACGTDAGAAPGAGIAMPMSGPSRPPATMPSPGPEGQRERPRRSTRRGPRRDDLPAPRHEPDRQPRHRRREHDVQPEARRVRDRAAQEPRRPASRGSTG